MVVSFGFQREVERGAGVDRALRPDLSAVALDDSLDDGQTHTGAFELVVVVQPLERIEEFGRVLRIESGAVVADVENPRSAVGRRANLDARPGTLPVYLKALSIRF